MAEQSLQKLGRLKKRPEFLYVRDGKFAGRRTLALQMRAAPDKDIDPKVGFTATKRIGNAVIRNRAKRRLRQAAASVLGQRAQKGMYYVLIARRDTATAPYINLLRDLEKALDKIGQ